LKDPITAANMVHTALHAIKSRSIDSRENIVFTITHFKSGHTYNVFPDDALMQGSIRSFDSKTLAKMKNRIHEICNNVAAAFECTAEVKLQDLYPPIINHPTETTHVIRLAKQHFGEKHFS
jgi:hippurate hydrolase